MDKKTIIFLLITTILVLLVIISFFAIKPKKPSIPPIESVKMREVTPSPQISTQTPPQLPTKTGLGNESPEYIQKEKEFLQNTPLLQKLPFGDPNFEVEYIDEQHIIIHSKTTNKEGGFQAARNWFIENQIDISKILVEYK